MLAQEKITIVEDSSSQEDLEEDEILNDRNVKGKKQVPLKVISASTEIKILEQLKDVQIKSNLSHQQHDLMKQQSVMTTLCADEEKIAEASTQCNFEGNESPGVPVIMGSYNHDKATTRG